MLTVISPDGAGSNFELREPFSKIAKNMTSDATDIGIVQEIWR